ncbi:MAG: inositol monophosphatase family protein [Planctomycetota bacterium]
MGQFRDVCEEAARAGGRVLREMRGRINPREKSPKDLVTDADFASQEAIRGVLAGAFPEHEFLGEEGGEGQRATTRGAALSDPDGYCWVVDPLDGTLNYARQLPNYSVSVALRRGDRVVCGVVYDPVLEECFAAELGEGVVLNGGPIGPSGCERVDQGLIAASLPAQVARGSREIDRFVAVMCEAQAIRRMGSAALNLCYVAMGRLDAYWATCVKVWDIAAGQLIVTEAGGVLSHVDGGAFDLERPQFVAAATPPLHQELVRLLRRASELEGATGH